MRFANQKGSLDLALEQRALVTRQQGREAWREEVAYPLRLESSEQFDDSSGTLLPPTDLRTYDPTEGFRFVVEGMGMPSQNWKKALAIDRHYG